MRYKVPQDVQREDRIFLFLTVRQLVILLAGGGISYVLFLTLAESYDLGILGFMLVALPLVFSVALAFIKISGMGLFQMFLLILEAIKRPPKRVWVQGGGTQFVSMGTTVPGKKQKKSAQMNTQKQLPKDLDSIVKILDQ